MIIRTKLTALVTVSALALTGCVTTQPMGERTQSGAIIGGMLGAAAGAFGNDSDPGMGALVGGAAGALAGGAIGAALDRQARDLRGSLANDDIRIQNTGQELVVTMPEGILFDIDSAAIRANLQADLRALARNLQQYPNTTVDVIGHTDNTGSAGYNQDLSQRRAQAVAGVLLEAGVSPGRVRAFGRGEDEPVASNLTPQGRAQNRRVEVIIRPR
ncbi:OmpA family protein [Roseicyclus mahoneyensis]|jgi:outer membrane protein OmpA-like peptidoglycan-associated protein|uniref:Outer membrane protein OmpA-like peptidoglycan-associated protein n=1 Tax=Roseicyclus mahoneyensis TaxID=164332 RepID=A0A316GLY4_9RHOB|nr:outer membrane protein OmpA-like peptidoglycan-associated protein [Roseicyclus mahoneyensis]